MVWIPTRLGIVGSFVALSGPPFMSCRPAPKAQVDRSIIAPSVLASYRYTQGRRVTSIIWRLAGAMVPAGA